VCFFVGGSIDSSVGSRSASSATPT
jgi:hypothetical protein